MELYDRVPPQNLSAERAVLGSCILEPNALGAALETLKPEDFYDLNHRTLFETMKEMYAANRPVDFLTLTDELTQRGLFERLGGQPFLGSLTAEVPTTANAPYHAEIVKERAMRRRLIEAGTRIVSLAYSSEMESSMILDEAERTIFEVSQERNRTDFRQIGAVIGGTFHDIESRYNQSGSEVVGFETGFSDLDRLTGGFQPGSLNIIAARPSMGKTALALNIAQFGGGGGNPSVLIFSMEMPAEQLALRMLAAQSGVDLQSMKTGTFGRGDWDELTNAAGVLSRLPVFIDDSSLLTTMEFRSKCRRFKSRYPSLGLIVVDYLQLMSFGGGRRTDNRQQEVAEISRMLKGVARELDCPVIALSQLSRETEKRDGKKPQLSDLRDSGAIEQDADIVMFIYREDYYDGTNQDLDSEALISVAKNRNGPTGEAALMFQRNITRFCNAYRG
ncbi:MAG: replicative DNA helicase [Synergistaceae bacterium]|nr:replicative DNA helicase [Synergistaceae bacterium]